MPESPLSPFPDPEPTEAQAGKEEAVAAGGEAGHAGPAPEDTRAAQSSHGMRREMRHHNARPRQPRFLRVLLLSRGASLAQWAGVSAWAHSVGQTAGQSWGGLCSTMTRRNQLLDPPLPCEVGVLLTAGGWKENCFTYPNLLFLYKNEQELTQTLLQPLRVGWWLQPGSLPSAEADLPQPSWDHRPPWPPHSLRLPFLKEGSCPPP